VLLYTNLENYKALKVARFLSCLEESGLVKAFVCFKDTDGNVKSMVYENGEFHQLDVSKRTVRKLSPAIVYRTLIRLKKGLTLSELTDS
jgi:hypothetical protein